MGLFDKVRSFGLFAGRQRGKALKNLVQRIEPKSTHEDTGLPAQELEILNRIVEQVTLRELAEMNRGIDNIVLFEGDTGTAKAMAAEVIANQLGLDLYRIDLSSVVSKYIGETEKNLRLVFDAAESEDAILFFDEADALFGKRSEVKDSHDRYANVEISYLLQRLKGYHGLVILATNRKENLDPAFIRRIRFIVEFPHPDKPQNS